MHIPDNYLSPLSCAVTAGVAAPVLAYSVKKVKEAVRDNREMAPMLGVASSLSFLMMMFNVPVPGGTTAHAVGSVLLAILLFSSFPTFHKLTMILSTYTKDPLKARPSLSILLPHQDLHQSSD